MRGAVICGRCVTRLETTKYAPACWLGLGLGLWLAKTGSNLMSNILVLSRGQSLPQPRAGWGRGTAALLDRASQMFPNCPAAACHVSCDTSPVTRDSVTRVTAARRRCCGHAPRWPAWHRGSPLARAASSHRLINSLITQIIYYSWQSTFLYKAAFSLNIFCITSRNVEY